MKKPDDSVLPEELPKIAADAWIRARKRTNAEADRFERGLDRSAREAFAFMFEEYAFHMEIAASILTTCKDRETKKMLGDFAGQIILCAIDTAQKEPE